MEKVWAREMAALSVQLKQREDKLREAGERLATMTTEERAQVTGFHEELAGQSSVLEERVKACDNRIQDLEARLLDVREERMLHVHEIERVKAQFQRRVEEMPIKKETRELEAHCAVLREECKAMRMTRAEVASWRLGSAGGDNVEAGAALAALKF
jgi:chromosome segregation ATPase